MKILFFIESLHSGGKERRLVELIKALKRIPEIECQLVLTKKQIHFEQIFETGIKIHYLERKILKKDPRLFFLFYKICSQFKPDIIHVWADMMAIYAIPAKVLLGIPVVNNQITDTFGSTSLYYLLRNKLSFFYSDLIISNSKAGLNAYNPPKNKSHVIYNGFNFQRIQNLNSMVEVRRQINVSSTWIVGMVASFSVYKDYQTYIKAAHLVLQKRKDVTFLCVGAGESEPYKKMIAPEFEDKILILGKQLRIESIMNICNIGVLSTFTEGISNAILEFMALGKPVVATSGGGTKEIVVDGKTGFLLPPKSPEIMAEKIEYLLNNPEFLKDFGVNGRIRIQEKFNIETMAISYLNQYLRLVECLRLRR